ncbi:MAG: hypothetical protein LBC84_09720 [Prevotellaceae bacterium]|nr:hypothetical protein [Prevotellaceae bacterium]
MNKYHFVMHHGSSELFLKKIQELGLVDIVRGQKAIDERSKEIHDLLLRYKAAIKFLSGVKSDPKVLCPQNDVQENRDNPQKILIQIEEAISRKEQIITRKTALRKEMELAAPWGIFNHTDRERIQELHYTLHAYAVPKKRFQDQWRENYPLFEINRSKDTVYFVVLHEQGTPYEFPLSEIKFPEDDVYAIQAEVDTLDNEINEIEQEFKTCLQYNHLLTGQIASLRSEFDRYMAGKSVQKEAEEHIDILTGFAPRTDSVQICTFLNKEDVLYIEEPAVEEDAPPVKLRNNWFARLYEPIGELYMLPKYGELDLTPYFAPFYMLFFGLCLGDMGYGLILIIAGTLAKKFMPAIRGYASLVQFLGLGAVLMAAISGGFFGMSLSDVTFLPESVRNSFFSSIHMFWLAILFGIFHILFARLLSAVDAMLRFGWLHGLSNIGWTFLIAWCVRAYAATQVDGLGIPKLANLIWLGFSLVLILFFTATKGNIFKRLGSGLASLWDITGFFGDTLSYIRLFGLGLSGGILGLIVNSVASGMSGIPYLGWFFALLMLLVGHGAVLMLSCIGSFVHPLRLTFVEFYKNVGFSGGGREFMPLKQ